MDPDANLAEQRKLATQILQDDDSSEGAASCINVNDAVRLADLVASLDGWIRFGGHLPADWKVK